MTTPRLRVLIVLLAAWLGVVTSSPAAAQYFGQNKVQHRTFAFEVLQTEHFDIYFYPEERHAAMQAARMAERWYSRLSALLDHQLEDRQPVVLYASHVDFTQTNIVSGIIEEGTGGVTEGLKRRVVLPLAATLAETDHVLGHELVHAFQYDMALRPGEQAGASALDRLPLWLVEGMAEYLSLGPDDANTAMWIRDRSRDEKLPDIDKLDDPRLFPYRWGHALWAYLAGRWGEEVVVRVFSDALDARSATDVLASVTGLSIKDLSREWHDAIRSHYGPILQATVRAGSLARGITEDRTREGGVNVSPALSPDGTRVVYLSARSLLSVDLYLADASSGRIIRRLVNTAVDAHFTSLQFINSAGSWHPDGRQFAFGAIRGGSPVLVIMDTGTGHADLEIPFPSLGDILSPSWSPDGDRIAFSATSGGVSDLFIYTVSTRSLRRLTADAYADLQPAWSPTGSSVAFVTDRFTTNLDALAAGVPELAAIDPATGAIERRPTFGRGKSTNPQWTADGHALYFLSDRTGVTNIYRLTTETGAISQVTNLDAGVSGVTALSPALAASAAASRIAFSAYDNGRLGLFVLDSPPVLAGAPLVPVPETPWPASLPPEQRRSGDLVRMLRDPHTGLPAALAASESYHPRLSLDFIGQPYLGVGVSRFGPSFGGGLSFLFSDMLGNQTLTTAIDASTYGLGIGELAQTFGGLVEYRNLTRRWNWGVAAEQSPSIAGGFVSGLAVAGGELAYVEESIVQRQTYRGVNGVLSYPFSRARRIDAAVGYAHLSYEETRRIVVSSWQTGDILSDDTVTVPLAAPLNLATAGAALVGDSAVFGATSPVAGRRSRLEAVQTYGSVSFTSAIADYRRYFMPVSFYTVAARIMHVGRYGPGAEDARLVPLFIGYPELVRGYDIGSFTTSECTVGPRSTCEEFDRLLGSRFLLGNLELRFPILRPFGVRSGMYGKILPVEAAVFVDSGVAWTRDTNPRLFGGERQGVSSAGVTIRVNLLGFAIGQFDIARPFDRPTRGWMWSFHLTPGF